MDIRVLGPVDALRDGAAVPIGGPRPRAIVATLALAGDAVSVDRLVEEVWHSHPPPSAVGTLQSYLSRLRGVLGADHLINGGRSYRLVVEAGTLDVARFRDGLATARDAAAAGDLDAAAIAYRAALGTWRGEVAEGLDAGPLLREAAARLNEERLIAIEEQVDVALVAGRHREVIPDLDALTTAHPHRERLHEQRMVALYRSGRQVDALVGFQVARQRLVDDLGIEPGPRLQELQQRILAQDPGLEASTTGTGSAPSAGRRHGAAHARPTTDARVDPGRPAVAGRRAVAGPGAATQPQPWSADVSGQATTAHRGPTAERDVVTAGRGEPPTTGDLPAPLDTFVGRAAEREEVAALLDQTRLVSLVGAGGCGKTQLALRVATDVRADYPDGVWWVELGAHRDPELVDRAVGTVLGVPEPAGGSWREAVIARLSGGTPLLVLDNCEHLVEACAELVATLLRHCPRVRVLTTSREPLDVAGERAWRVPSLTVPPADATTSGVVASEAAQLLALRATAARPGFALSDEDPQVVARICRELDGIPLALELAAARLAVLSVEELADRLEDRFRVLSGGRRSAPARHRTLEAAIGWSFDLLDEAERRLLTRLSVFAGGFTVPDVEVVCTAPPLRGPDVLDLLAALVDKSLVQRIGSPNGPARHDLLATVRSFAEARLDAEERDAVHGRHAEHYAAIAQAARPRLTGFGQVEWLNRLHAEQDNLRQVIAGGGEPAARVVASAWIFWLEFGHARDGDRWVRQVLADPAIAARGASSEPRAHELLLALHEGAARLAAAVDEPDRVADHLAAAGRCASELGDRSAQLRCEAFRASEAARGGDLDRAARVIEEAARLATDDVDAWSRASLEQHRASVAERRGDLQLAVAAYRAAEVGFQQVGDEWGACLARLGAARGARRAGDIPAAVRDHRANLARGLELTVSTLDFIGLPQDLRGLAAIASEADEHALAASLAGAATTVRTAVERAAADDDHEQRTRMWRRAVTALGDQAARDAFARGRAGTAEDAVRFALDRTARLAAGIPAG